MEPIIVGGVLYHHGILGQEWGVTNGPPYPLSTGSHSVAEKKQAKRGVYTLRGYLKNRKTQKKRKQALEKARAARIKKAEERKKAEAFAIEKKKALESTNASDIVKYKEQFSKDELIYAYNKIDYAMKLENMANANKKSTWDKVDRVMQRIDQTRDWVEKGTRFYNAMAKVVNAALDENLPIIGEKNQNNNPNNQNNNQKNKKKNKNKNKN